MVPEVVSWAKEREARVARSGRRREDVFMVAHAMLRGGGLVYELLRARGESRSTSYLDRSMKRAGTTTMIEKRKRTVTYVESVAHLLPSKRPWAKPRMCAPCSYMPRT